MYPETAVTIPIKVCASAPSSEVLAAIKEACREVPEILSLPEPKAYILSYDQFGISYLAKFWVTDYERKDIVITEIGRLIWYKFQRRGISVPVAVEEQVKEVLDAFQEKRAVSAAAEEREKTYTDLVRSNFLRYQEGERAGEMIVSEDELRDLASLVRRETFGLGEVLFRQGEKGDSCYVVAAGLIRGEIVYEENAKRFTSEFRVGPGGIFGEMSLFTGMPRTATGIVEADAELLQISSESFAHLISRNAKLAEVIAEIVSNRNLKNQEFLKKIKELSLKDLEAASSKKSILERLLRLVHLGKKR
jgi:CRP-like cAMP-binding protein